MKSKSLSQYTNYTVCQYMFAPHYVLDDWVNEEKLNYDYLQNNYRAVDYCCSKYPNPKFEGIPHPHAIKKHVKNANNEDAEDYLDNYSNIYPHPVCLKFLRQIKKPYMGGWSHCAHPLVVKLILKYDVYNRQWLFGNPSKKIKKRWPKKMDVDGKKIFFSNPSKEAIESIDKYLLNNKFEYDIFRNESNDMIDIFKKYINKVNWKDISFNPLIFIPNISKSLKYWKLLENDIYLIY